jgi:hypothetical protein
MQQNTPDRDDQLNPSIPYMGGAVPRDETGRSIFTEAEWKTLVEVPVKVGRAIMAVSPSGAIGMAKEVKALRTGLTEAIQASDNPILKELGWHAHMEGGMEALWKNVGHVFGDRWDAVNVRKVAVDTCQDAAKILKKAPPQDAQAYKECVYTSVQGVALAGKEGGFVGIGSKVLSQAEEDLLVDVANALNIQRS